jgi:hypothetical protein
MSRVEWQVRVDRIVVNGVEGPAPSVAELQPLIEAAVRAAVAEAALPAGRSMHASVQVQAPVIGGAGAVAHAVGGAVAQAVGGAGGQARPGGRGHG